MKRIREGSTINQESLLPSCILLVNNYPFNITFLKALQFAFQRPDWKCTLGHCTFIPENNKTTCFTIKLDLKKLETVFRGPQANFLSLLWAFAPSAGKCKKFLHFSNTAFSHWLSLNKIEGKIKRLFNLSWVLLPANKRSLRTRKEGKKVRDCYPPFSPH